MPKTQNVETHVPREVLNRFEDLKGVPLNVIAELLGRARIPTDLQAAFWKVAAAKDLKYITGKIRIKTNRDNTKEVTIFDSHGPITFHVPDDLTDDQLAELKRAQGANLPVILCYQVEGANRPVNSVEVWEAEEPKKEPKKSEQEFI